MGQMAVRLRPGAEPLLRARADEFGLEPGAPITRLTRGLVSLRLAPAAAGREAEVLGALEAAGLVASRGLLFEPDGPGQPFALDRQVILRLRAPAPDGVHALASAAGFASWEPLDGGGRTYLLAAADAPAALEGAVALARRAEVDWALPDFAVPVRLMRTPTDPYWSHQWYQAAGTGGTQAEAAWDVTLGDPQVVVAVVDTGVELDHPDFDPVRILPGYNALTQQADQTPLAGAVDAHGTACSGVIFAQHDSAEGLAGVCPGCSLMPIKMMDGMADLAQLSQGYRALQFALSQGAWVVSNSWGIDEQYTRQVDMQPYYQAVRDLVSQGRGGQGAVVLFASGNGEQDWFGNVRATEIGPNELQAMPEVMAVGGTWTDDRVVVYSDYGPNLSVVAPTGSLDYNQAGIFTADTLGERGFSRHGKLYMPGMWGSDMDTGVSEPDSTGNYSAHFNGTSAACPIAAGVVALALSANPGLSGAQARLVVERTADKVGGVTYDARGHHERYGFGRVNAARAIRVASLGLELPDGAACAEALNCAHESCWKTSPGEALGVCVTPCQADEDCPAGARCGPQGFCERTPTEDGGADGGDGGADGGDGGAGGDDGGQGGDDGGQGGPDGDGGEPGEGGGCGCGGAGPGAQWPWLAVLGWVGLGSWLSRRRGRR
jgi:subtilisin family serine protease